MADNTLINAGTGGDNIATDELATLNGVAVVGVVKAQRNKIGFGSDGVFRDVDSSNPLPVLVGSDADNTATGTLTAAAQTVVLSTAGKSSANIKITNTWVGTITFEGSTDGTNWDPINAVAASASTPQTTTTVNGSYRLTPASFIQIRVIMSAFTSGTATISMRSSMATGGFFANQILPTRLTDGTNTATIKAASTAAVAADLPIVVALHPSSPTPMPAITKGTQGATGVTTQDVKDAGRSQIMLSWEEMTGTAAVESALTNFTLGSRAGAALTAATSATVTTGKILRIQSITIYIKATSTVINLARFRIRQAATVANTSPVIWDAVLTGSTASVIAANGGVVLSVPIPDGLEVAAGQQITFTFFTTAITCTVGMSITGYEY